MRLDPEKWVSLRVCPTNVYRGASEPNFVPSVSGMLALLLHYMGPSIGPQQLLAALHLSLHIYFLRTHTHCISGTRSSLI